MRFLLIFLVIYAINSVGSVIKPVVSLEQVLPAEHHLPASKGARDAVAKSKRVTQTRAMRADVKSEHLVAEHHSYHDPISSFAGVPAESPRYRMVLRTSEAAVRWGDRLVSVLPKIVTTVEMPFEAGGPSVLGSLLVWIYLGREALNA